MKRPSFTQRGFTMLEVLVALLILLIGLLGLAGLLVTTQQGEVEAYQRKQAAVLLQDMVDRLRANNKVAGIAGTCYAFTTDAAAGTPALGTGNVVNYTPGCTGGTTGQNDRGTEDLRAWNNALLGTSEVKGAAQVGGLIEARGCITNPSPDVYTISVAWRGLQPTVAPPAVYTCGTGQYGSEPSALRRVISITVRIAKLSA
jgi:type IV pilus assembly protein PilV